MTAEQSYFYRLSSEEGLYAKATEGLTQLQPNKPYGSGPHNTKAFKYAVGAVPVAYPRVFEIGFNYGYSAAIMLELGCQVHSIDIRDEPLMRVSEGVLLSRYPKFRCQLGVTVATCQLPPFTPDFCFIDGAHDYNSIVKDIRYCRDVLKCKRFLMDDWPKIYGDTEKAVLDEDLLPLAIIGSMAYCVVPSAVGMYNPFYDERGKSTH